MWDYRSGVLLSGTVRVASYCKEGRKQVIINGRLRHLEMVSWRWVDRFKWTHLGRKELTFSRSDLMNSPPFPITAPADFDGTRTRSSNLPSASASLYGSCRKRLFCPGPPGPAGPPRMLSGLVRFIA